MKELYISPEVELIGFVSAERLANDGMDYSDENGWAGNKDKITNGGLSEADGDIFIPFDKVTLN